MACPRARLAVNVFKYRSFMHHGSCGSGGKPPFPTSILLGLIGNLILYAP